MWACRDSSILETPVKPVQKQLTVLSTIIQILKDLLHIRSGKLACPSDWSNISSSTVLWQKAETELWRVCCLTRQC